MKLTEKAKEQFEKWLLDHEMHNQGGYNFDYPKWFSALHPSFQWGVYQDWADSIKFELRVTVNHGSGWYEVLINIPEYWNSYPTRQEARNAAIEKLNEIINEK